MATSHSEEPEEDIIHGIEEKEPKFFYTKGDKDLQGVLKFDSITCVATHPKVVCIGTERGLVYLLDHLGNVIRELRVHDVAVNQISIDGAADYIATCFDDGKVRVTQLYENCIHDRDLDFRRRVRSVAIDPFYYKPGSCKRLVIGERRLILHEEIPFSRSKQTVLEDPTAEGGVKIIKWNPGGNLLLWASHREFSIYDLISRTTLELKQWPMMEPVDLKCHVCWEDRHSVVVGWNDSVQVYRVQEADDPLFGASTLSAELAYSLPLESSVCGVGSHDGNILVFSCTVGLNIPVVEGAPLLQVIQPNSEDFTVLRTDVISREEFQNCTASQYSLDCLPDEGRFVIVSPKGVLMARPCGTDERVDWFIKQREYQKALDAIQQSRSPPVRHTRMDVGLQFINHLLNTKEYEAAAALCPQIIGVDRLKWEQLLKKFEAAKQLKVVADYIPATESSSLPSKYYEMVLKEYLLMDHEGFLKKIKLWPHHLYNQQSIVNHILCYGLSPETLTHPRVLLEALAVLYHRLAQYECEFKLYVRLGCKEKAFDLIKQRNLYSIIHKSAKALMKLDSTQAVEAMLSSPEVDCQLIVKALDTEKEPHFLYLFLHALYEKNPEKCTNFHTHLVKLYAEFDREKLLELLKENGPYAIHDAVEVCRHRRYFEELVYLLGRTGDIKEALNLILRELNDFERAIDFCKEHDDKELWDDLINFSSNNPSYISALLKRIGTFVDPSDLIKRIDAKLEIPSLKNDLVKLIQDYVLHIQIQENCTKIVYSDSYDVHDRLLSTRQRGFSVSYENQCAVCCNKLIIENLKEGTVPSEVAIFHCRHMFHSSCLTTKKFCTICAEMICPVVST